MNAQISAIETKCMDEVALYKKQVSLYCCRITVSLWSKVDQVYGFGRLRALFACFVSQSFGQIVLCAYIFSSSLLMHLNTNQAMDADKFCRELEAVSLTGDLNTQLLIDQLKVCLCVCLCSVRLFGLAGANNSL